MSRQASISAFLGLDIGTINSRASYFRIIDQKYRLMLAETAATSLGGGLHIGTGAGLAMRRLDQLSEQSLLEESGRLLMPVNAAGNGVDRVALTTSAGPWPKTALLGLAAQGSMAAGRALVDSLPLDLCAAYSLADLADEPAVIDALVKAQPDFLIITGGEDGGAESHLQRWIDAARLVCRLLPSSINPVIVFAGNPKLESYARRRLEPMADLYVAPNLQPQCGEWDFIPSQVILNREIMRHWEDKVPGLKDLNRLSGNLNSTVACGLARIIRYMARAKQHQPVTAKKSGVLAIDLGGGSVNISAGLNGLTGDVVLPAWPGISEMQSYWLDEVYHWAAVPVNLQEVNQFLSNTTVHPRTVPETLTELALFQAFARVRIKQAISKFTENYSWFPFDYQRGLYGTVEPVIASGSVLTDAPTPGQSMLMLLDGLQPWGISTFVLDKFHILPLLGLIGEIEPVLAVQVLGSEVLINLGTVIAAVSDAPEGEVLGTIRVETAGGKNYSVDIIQGTLRRLIITEGTEVLLDIKPEPHTDVGFGECGKGGKVKTIGGSLGVVIDARGRPLRLPVNTDDRVEQLRRWLWALGG